MSALTHLLEIQSGTDGTLSIWCPTEVVCRGAVSRGGPSAGLLHTALCLPRWGVISWQSRAQQRKRVPCLLRHVGGQRRQTSSACPRLACMTCLWRTRVGVSHRGAFWARLACLLLPCAAGRKLGPDKLLWAAYIDLTADGLAELGVPQIQRCSCTMSSSSGAQLYQVSVGAQPG